MSGEDKAVPVGVVYLYSEGLFFSELVGPDHSVGPFFPLRRSFSITSTLEQILSTFGGRLTHFEWSLMALA